MMNYTAEQKNVMTLQAQAIWNNDKGAWDVVMTTFEVFKNLEGKWLSTNKEHHLEVEACNELVFVESLLHTNGYAPLVYGSVKKIEDQCLTKALIHAIIKTQKTNKER